MDVQVTRIQDTERAFFSALTDGDTATLEWLLSDDFLMIDFLNGAEVSKEELITFLDTSQIVYESIEIVESRIRFFGETAIVTGWTAIQGQIGRLGFGGDCRYTHVYVTDENGAWWLVSAQGTPIDHDGI